MGGKKRGEVATSSYHGTKISGSQRTVIMQIWEKNLRKNSHVWLSCAWLHSGIDCSQSPIFAWDRLDIPRLTVTAILIFKCTAGAGVGGYSSRGGNRPRPLSSFDTHVRWQPVTQSSRSRWSYGKIEDCEQSNSGTKRLAHTFLPSFDNVNCRLCQEGWLRSRDSATMVTWRDVTLLFSLLQTVRHTVFVYGYG